MPENTKEKSKEKCSFEVPPPPIPQKDIKEVINADVVVMGGGISGCCASLSAAQAGAKTVLLEKTPNLNTRGAGNAAVGSKLQKEQGVEIDRNEIVAEMMRWSAYKSDQRLVNLWADKSGECMDWVLEMAEASGIEAWVMPPMPSKNYKSFGIVHGFNKESFMEGQPRLLGVLEKNMHDWGVDIQYKTAAVQLIREEKGRITGVIAQTSDGYKQFNAPALVLCTGGYQNNPEMLQKYMPFNAHALNCAYRPVEGGQGDGHKMGLWIGAAMQDEPHCCIFWDGGGIDLEGLNHVGITLPRQAWLNVNILGERYVNEDIPVTYRANADCTQPGHVKWAIWDDKWEDEVPNKFVSPNGPPRLILPFHSPELLQEKIKKGAILLADTIEELVRKMDVPYETCMVTIKRYNELARMGKDLDFGKTASKMTTIEKPPFYAAKMGTAILATLSGLKINTKLQVLDTDMNVIPGLYAAGNVSGGFFARDYPIPLTCTTHGRAITFGRLAGLNAAAEKDQL